MAKITYVEHGGARHQLEVPTGWSVMEGAVKNGVKGIEADCGGSCVCATCHVYVDPDWLDRAGDISFMEESMLDFAVDVRPNSRLSCQIKITAEMDGMTVRIPESQP